MLWPNTGLIWRVEIDHSTPATMRCMLGLWLMTCSAWPPYPRLTLCNLSSPALHAMKLGSCIYRQLWVMTCKVLLLLCGFICQHFVSHGLPIFQWQLFWLFLLGWHELCVPHRQTHLSPRFGERRRLCVCGNAIELHWQFACVPQGGCGLSSLALSPTMDLKDPLRHVVCPGRTIVVLWLALRTFYADTCLLWFITSLACQASCGRKHKIHSYDISGKEQRPAEMCADFDRQLPGTRQNGSAITH